MCSYLIDSSCSISQRNNDNIPKKTPNLFEKFTFIVKQKLGLSDVLRSQ